MRCALHQNTLVRWPAHSESRLRSATVATGSPATHAVCSDAYRRSARANQGCTKSTLCFRIPGVLQRVTQHEGSHSIHTPASAECEPCLKRESLAAGQRRARSARLGRSDRYAFVQGERFEGTAVHEEKPACRRHLLSIRHVAMEVTRMLHIYSICIAFGIGNEYRTIRRCAALDGSHAV